MGSALTLCVFIDALGWEALQGRPFLDDLLPVRAPLESVFGYSCACCPTILTGRMPREHGHLAFYARPPRDGGSAGEGSLQGLSWLSLLPRSLTGRGRVRRWLSRGVAALRGFDGYFQLYDVPFDRLRHFEYTEQRDIYRPGGIRGQVPTIFDRLEACGVPYHLSSWRRGEPDNLRAAQRALERGEVRFAYVYLPALDARLHAVGARGSHHDVALEGYERAIRGLYEAARRSYRSVHLHVFSDHGMTDVVDQSDLVRRVERLGLRFGDDYVAMYDSTMARFWFLSDHAREPIAEVLAGESRGHVVGPDELRAWACDFADDRYGELIFLLDPGVLLCPSYMGSQPLAGMHGYDPRHPQATACYLASHEPLRRPRRLDDLYGVMLACALGEASR